MPHTFLASLIPLAPATCVCGYDDAECICIDAERALRRYAYPRAGDALPPLSPEQRAEALDELAHVEGYDRADYVTASDQDLCRGVLCALADYCRDKGLL